MSDTDLSSLPKTQSEPLTDAGPDCARAAGSASDLPAQWEYYADERDKLAGEYRDAGGIEDAITMENVARAYRRCANELRAVQTSIKTRDTIRLDWLEKYGATPICSRDAIDAAMREPNNCDDLTPGEANAKQDGGCRR